MECSGDVTRTLEEMRYGGAVGTEKSPDKPPAQIPRANRRRDKLTVPARRDKLTVPSEWDKLTEPQARRRGAMPPPAEG